MLDKRGPTGENWQTFLKPVDQKLAKQKKYLSVKKYKPKLYTPLNGAEENENYKALCRGIRLRVSHLLNCLRPKFNGAVVTLIVIIFAFYVSEFL